MYLLQRMGWKEGEGLGKNKTGSLEPLVLDVKTDRKGDLATLLLVVTMFVHHHKESTPPPKKTLGPPGLQKVTSQEVLTGVIKDLISVTSQGL